MLRNIYPILDNYSQFTLPQVLKCLHKCLHISLFIKSCCGLSKLFLLPNASIMFQGTKIPLIIINTFNSDVKSNNK